MIKLEKLVDKVFRKNGLLAKHFSGYEPRDPQIKMARTVVEAIKKNSHAVIEAGTGTGKTFGYLVAACLASVYLKKKVVISTFTVTLQNQIMSEYMPLIQKIISDLLDMPIFYELAKGRSHYLCKRKLDELYEEAHVREVAGFRELQHVVRRRDSFKNGDRTELGSDFPFELWKEIRSDSEDCLGDESPHYNTCYIQQARKRLKEADIIITNHSLFFADLQLKEKGLAGVLPEYDIAVFDEAHRLEDVFSKYYQIHASVRSIEQLFDRVIKRQSAWAKEVIQEENLPVLVSMKQQALNIAHGVFSEITRIMDEMKVSSGLLRRPVVRSNPFNEVFNKFEMYLRGLQDPEMDSSIQRGLGNMIDSVERMREAFDQLLLNSNTKEWANWAQVSPAREGEELIEDPIVRSYRCSLYGAPIEAHTVLSRSLFAEKLTILTSATLTVRGDFSFLAKRLGIKNYIGFQVDSPFDYFNQSLLIVPKDAPDPRNAEAFAGYSLMGIKRLVSHFGGRTFVLFTNQSHMLQYAEDLREWFEGAGIKLLVQTRNADRDTMLQEFKESEKAVIFGVESFWEGVDVPGDDLVCVIILKLPFPVPTEPIIEARSARIREKGGNSFVEYALPLCILKLKQGFGRLIRTVHDRGVVVIFDRRVIRSKFGSIILDSLPPAKFSTNLDDMNMFY